jgi:hypothetical protein
MRAVGTCERLPLGAVRSDESLTEGVAAARRRVKMKGSVRTQSRLVAVGI